MFARRLTRVAMLSLAGLLLVACVGTRLPAPRIALPTLQLAPDALGRELALQQRLDIRYGEHLQSLDALLEADASAVNLAVQAMGRTGVRLHWDGTTLRQQRADWLPPAVRGERVLDDLQFSLWPAEAIRAALPPSWTLVDAGEMRRLVHDGHDWLVLERLDGERHLRLRNLAEGYALEITSVPLSGDAP